MSLVSPDRVSVDDDGVRVVVAAYVSVSCNYDVDRWVEECRYFCKIARVHEKVTKLLNA